MALVWTQELGRCHACGREMRHVTIEGKDWTDRQCCECTRAAEQGLDALADVNWYSPWGCGVWDGEVEVEREDVRKAKEPTEREKRLAAHRLVRRMVDDGTIGEDKYQDCCRIAKSLLAVGSIRIGSA